MGTGQNPTPPWAGGVPVLQCGQCGEVELEHATMLRVEELLEKVDAAAELEIIRFAA